MERDPTLQPNYSSNNLHFDNSITGPLDMISPQNQPLQPDTPMSNRMRSISNDLPPKYPGAANRDPSP